jgi:hypothetical protein
MPLFNNISVILWQSVLLVEETEVPEENHWPAASHWQTLSHKVVHLALDGIRTHNLSGTDCLGSCKSKYHTMTATTAPGKTMINKKWMVYTHLLFCMLWYNLYHNDRRQLTLYFIGFFLIIEIYYVLSYIHG